MSGSKAWTCSRILSATAARNGSAGAIISFQLTRGSAGGATGLEAATALDRVANMRPEFTGRTSPSQTVTLSEGTPLAGGRNAESPSSAQFCADPCRAASRPTRARRYLQAWLPFDTRATSAFVRSPDGRVKLLGNLFGRRMFSRRWALNSAARSSAASRRQAGWRL